MLNLEKCGVPSLILVISAQLQAFPLFQVIPCASRETDVDRIRPSPRKIRWL